MAELLLVNPSRRKSKHRSRKTNPMPPALAAWHRKHGHKVHRKRKARKSNPHVRKASHRRRNPSLRGLGGKLGGRVLPTIKQGFFGAAGGLMNDVLMGQVLTASWMPSVLASGLGAIVPKALGALLVGFLGGFMLRGRGRDLADGAMTIALHDVLKPQLQAMLPTGWTLGEYITFAPSVGFSDQGVPAPGLSGMGAYLTGPGGSGLGEYITGDIGNPDFYGQNAPGSLSLY